MTTSFVYSPQRGWLNQVTTASSGTTLLEGLYTRDLAGRIMSVASSAPNEDWIYTYDSLDRLTVADNVERGALDQTFTYDLAGNITSVTGVGTDLPLNLHPATIRVSSVSVTP